MSKRREDLSETVPPKKNRTEDGEELDAEETKSTNGKNDERSGESHPNSLLNEGEVGIIESISLKNFMCHACLGPFKFGPNVNFVVGNNGSGKSAVLAALIVGLGGKATATNRGYSIKGFVKNGQNSADIAITLRNRGPDAFKADIYGEAIIVEQHISREGIRQYRLKSKTGHLVSTKKEELNTILDQFNIQVDNPVSILTQEMSKHFLQSKSEADKYKFFMKATQLEQMREDYAHIMRTKALTNEKIGKQDESLSELKELVKEKEDRYKSLASLDELQEKLEQLKNQMVWALVIELEKDLQPIKARIKTEEGRSVKYDQKVEEWQVKVSEEEEKFKAVQDRLQKITEETQVLGPQRTALKEDVQSKNKAYKETEAMFHRYRTQSKQLEKDHTQLQRRIEELKNSVNQSSQADLRERQERINSQQEQLKVLKDQEATTLQQTDQFQHAISKSRDELYQLRREEQDVKNVCESRKRRLKELKASRTDRLERFGENVPSLLNAIEEAHKGGRFRKKPVGPLGACFRLKYPEFGLAVESCLKGLLLSFCCDNFRDEQVLQSLMSRNFRTGRRPQINVCEFQNDVYDVRGKGVYHPDFPTILDAIEIDNAVVANCLIDMRGIERVLLIKDNSTARKVMQQQKAPKNCREAFTEAGDQVFTNRYYSSEMDRARYLGSDVETEIRQLEIEINNKVAQLSHFQQRLQSIEEEIRLNEVQLKKKQIQRRQIQENITKHNLEIADLENVEELQSVDISTLEEEAQDIWRRIESGKGKLEKAKEDMDVHRKILDEAEQNYKEIKEKISLIAEEADPIKEELSSIDTEIVKDKHLWRHYENKKKEHLYGIDKLKEDLTTKEKVLEENTSKASQICKERLEVTKTPKSIDLEINHLRERINTEQKLHGNREEIIRQYFEVLETYKRVKGQIKSLKKFMRLLTKIMEGRHRAYKIFRRYISLRCKYYFNTMLSQRGYHGKMNFDHKNETLSIAVQPGEGDKAALSDMRSLSGGERSFSTVCFILSLWDTMESPFRCLDEFDVYMDMVNRRISMDMMLKVANSQRYRQFIFLTPQSMSSLPSSSLIRILRMHDPERGQTTLPFRPRDQAEDSDD
ncbi:structural maintenance of chromosomes protein 6 isoform X2 [Callorhinchus milii]|uniref:Structural maintenance of chromosomes protein 6 n=2 Tax=Callorhinchus milii TaxID=7868 RepID=V9K9V7_CALMI|nr:structural maintenance of chromosomes protein 6 isoform X2 [Callorhinchus milii]XP_007895242.1 structural maintenance of chromosomes protein 6 isoform X2 [Callorhinchus milii]XP_042188969.1 structural maintenance of chromosomes protein 6 isoform X2 [Callorhinchus milii]XP_042188970.1 structural maintenance of chromosomes protein 6 isoform X2 [Callorhinchus milii]|eukprot:gi/632958784/ref/XP_007895241.1/ PREDICTED: structural maintenance of chromosomes protein 6 isoform X1 [Callorhinchus milii]